MTTEKKLTKKVVFNRIKEYLLVGLASFLNAVSMHTFINPNKLVPGGFSGLASLLYYVTGVDVSIMYIILNIPLLIVSLIMVKGDFTFKTIFATVVCTVALAVLPAEFVFVESKLIAVLFGAVLVGTAMYLASLYNGSNGGTEVVARIVYSKRPELNLSTIVMLANLSVYVVGSFVMVAFKGENIWTPVYSLVYILCGTKIMGLLSLGIDRPQRFIIITKQYHKLQEAITNKFKRGVTTVDTYDEDLQPREFKSLSVICQYRQMQSMKRLIRKHDSAAFVYIKDIYEVLGRPTFNRSYKYDKDKKDFV